MPGFKVLRSTDVPGTSAVGRVRQLVELEPDRISRAVDLARGARHGIFTGPELGQLAEQLGLGPQEGIHIVNAVRFLAGCLDRYDTTNADLAHDLQLAGLSEQDAQRLPQVLETIRPHASEIATADRELAAAYEGLPTITDFSATCQLRAIFSEPIGAEDVLGPERASAARDESDVAAWVPIAIVGLETRDFAGRRTATTFQAPLPTLKNLAATLEKVAKRLERIVKDSGATGAGSRRGRRKRST